MQVFIELIIFLYAKYSEVLQMLIKQTAQNNNLLKDTIFHIGLLERLRKDYNISIDEMDNIAKNVAEEIQEKGIKSIIKKD